ncbi:MAG: amidohydrolase [Planctomycetaceae bacterium]|nr:amidohydrolase [Planctomycetaceae bacterium]
MTTFPLSRRDLLASLSSAALVGLSASAAAAENATPELIDVHLHIASSRLSRSTGNEALPEPFDQTLQPGGFERLGAQIAQELRGAGVTQGLCMPSTEISDADPLGIQRSLTQAKHIAGVKLHAIGLAHPERFDLDHLKRVEAVLESGAVKALKAYLGYLHYDPYSVGYRAYFRLAAKYKIPVIFHTGDTNSERAKLKHAHPLAIDEIAVDFPHTNFVLAHFGNPWVLDAAQVMYKNPNVWVDLSAFLVGTAEQFATMHQSGVVERTVERVREGIEFVEASDRFLFGSDWPLAPIAAYRDVVAKMFPANERAGVFADNAKRLFRLS